MGVLDQILNELDEMYLVEHVTKKHDEARIQYYLSKNSVSSDTEFDNIIAEYYDHHYSKCVSVGGAISRANAAGKAKEIINKAYRKMGKDRLDAYYDGKNGLNGGMRAILDLIMDHLKEEAIEHHIRDVLDRHILPSDYDEKVEIIKEILDKVQINSNDIDRNRPERYAYNYEELIRLFMETKNIQAAKLRRL